MNSTLGTAVLAGLPPSTLAPFQWVLHIMAYTVLDHEPCLTVAVQELHQLPVTKRIQFKLSLLVYMSLLGHITYQCTYQTYWHQSLTYPHDVRALHASLSGNLVVPRTCRRIGNRVFLSPFREHGIACWQLKLLWSTTTFHSQLKTFLI